MKAAIYVRVSTSGQREASLDDQERECRDLCDEQGLEVCEVYRDYAQSGHDSQRPQYRAMIRDAKAGKFSVVVAHHLDRLWRDPGEQERVVDELDFASVRVMDCRGIDSGDEGARMLMTLMGMLAKQESIRTGLRVHRAHKGLALRGLNVGGKTYGYRNPGHSEGRLAIDDEQARWVRWIFEHIAEGWSCRAIAAELNRMGVASPGASWNRVARRKDGKWLQSTVYAMVRNRKYVGEFVWNTRRSKRRPGVNKRVAFRRDPKQWVTVRMDELRIVDEKLWERAHAVIARRSIEIGDKVKAGQKRVAAVSKGRGPKFLLSSILVCDKCGSRLVTNGPNQAYHCSTRSQGGRDACSNDVRVPRTVIEERVLSVVRDQMLSPAGLEVYRNAVRASSKKGMADFRGQEREWAEARGRLQRELDSLLAAVRAGGGDIPAIVGAMKDVQTRLTALGPAPEAPTEARIALVERLMAEYRNVLADLNDAVGERVTEAREVLRSVLGTVKVGKDEGGRPYADLQPSYTSDGSGGRI